jgi:hypothetical protein
MNKYYITNHNTPRLSNEALHHAIGFSDDDMWYLYTDRAIADTKFSLLHYELNTTQQFRQTTNGYEVVMCVYEI